MNKFESASILAGMSPNEEPQVSEPTNLHVITGEVVANSENGSVLVSMDGLVFSEDDTQYIEMDTIGGLEEGDEATIILAGEAGSSMTPLAIGSTGSVDRLSARVIEAELLIADKADIEDLEAATARIGDLEADHVSVNTLEAATARIKTLEVDHVSISDFEVEQANIDNLQAATADIDTIRANSAKVQNLTAAQLEADHATIGSLDTTYMHADMANADVAWINNGTIRDGAIVSAMINDVSANKLTAGTINGSVINVTNLNADNITAGTINGQRIGQGSLSLDKLSEDVYTESEVNDIVDDLNDRIDAQIETWTESHVPTLNNTPASAWTTNDLKAEHVGDICYVLNAGNDYDGYTYRFAYDNSTSSYKWVLIKDNQVTAALGRLTTAEGKIEGLESFESTTSSWITQTDEDLTSVKSRTSTLEGSVQVAQTYYATCNTAAGTAAKVATITPAVTDFTLRTGTTVIVNFSATNSNSSATLNLNSTGAKSIRYKDAALTSTTRGYLAANRLVILKYDGTYWQITGATTDANTYDRTAYKASLTATAAIPAGTVGVIDVNGKITALSTTPFDTSGPILYIGTAYTSSALTQTNNYSMYGTPFNLTTTKSGFTGTAGKPVYIVGTLNGRMFTPDSQIFTTTVPTQEDGKQYILLGLMSTATNATLAAEHPIFAYGPNGFAAMDYNNQQSLSTKVETSTFNTLSQTVESNTASITSLTTIAENNGLTSSTNITNTVNTVSQTASGNSAKITQLTTTLGTNADGTTKAGDVLHRTSAVEQDLSGFKTTVSETYATQTALATTNGNVTAAQTAADNAQAAADRANGRQVAYSATSSTGASTAAKVAACTNFPALAAGATVTVRFSTANTSTGAVTLNVNSTGAKTVYVNGAATSSSNQLLWGANANITFTYDGSYWRVDSEPRTWYGTGTVAAATAAKTATINEVVICKGTTVVLNMTYENTSTSATLNVTSTGAKNIYYGTTTTRPTTANGYGWGAGSTVSLTFDGQYWRIGDTTALARLTAAESTISSHTTSIEQNASAIALKADSSTTYTKTDVDGLISTEVTNRNAAITAKANEITSSVSETYATKTSVDSKADASDVTALAGRVTTAESNITQNANNIALKVSESDVTGNYVVGKINLNSTTATIAAQHINLQGAVTISDLSSDAQSATLNSNISVGGRNLVSSLVTNWRSTTVSESSSVGTSWEYMSRTASTTRISAIDLIPVDGDFVTVSLTSGYDAFLTFFDANGYMKKYLTWSNQRTVDLSEYSGVTAIGLTVRKSDNSTITLDDVATAKIKLERGNKATDWSPAPEDVDSAIYDAVNGGRNWLLDTGTFNDWVSGTGITFSNGVATFPSRSSLLWASIKHLTIPAADFFGNTWTFSFDYRSDDFSDTSGNRYIRVNLEASASYNASDRTKYRALNSSSISGAANTWVPTTEWQRGSVTFTAADESFLSGGSGDVYYVGIAIWAYTLNSFQVRRMKLEKGNTATDWSTAPEDAAKTATSYVTEITGQNGIMVHPSTDDDTGVRITSDVDIRQDNVSIANFGALDSNNNPTARVGKADGYHVGIDTDSLDVMDGTTTLASFGSEVLIGPTNDNHIEIGTMTNGNKGLALGNQSGYELEITPREFFSPWSATPFTFLMQGGNQSLDFANSGVEIWALGDPVESNYAKAVLKLNARIGTANQVGSFTFQTNAGSNTWSTPAGTVLWSGSWHMTAGHTATLKYNVSTCPTGIVLHFQPYANSTTRNWNHIYYFVPKTHVASSYNGSGIVVRLGNPDFSNLASKYLYISNDHITGNDQNNTSGTNSGITYNNAAWVMTQVIAV